MSDHQRTQQPFDRDIAIHVSDSSLLHLLWAGTESYKVRRWGKTYTSKRGPAETSGLLWGYTVSQEETDHVTIEQVSTDKHAKGTYFESELIKEVTAVKRQIVEERWPHLTMIGDFHTHVYKELSKANESGGWHASQGDIKWYEEDHSAETWPGRISLILTIAKHSKSRIEPARLADHIIHWQQLGRFRFWLSAYAVDECDGNRLVVSPKDDSDDPSRPHVYLDVPTIYGKKRASLVGLHRDAVETLGDIVSPLDEPWEADA